MSLSRVYVAHNASMQRRMSMTWNLSLLMESTRPRMPCHPSGTPVAARDPSFITFHPGWCASAGWGARCYPHTESRIPIWSPIINYLAKDMTTLLPSCEDRTLFDLWMMEVQLARRIRESIRLNGYANMNVMPWVYLLAMISIV